MSYRTSILLCDAVCIIYLFVDAVFDLGYSDFWIWTIAGVVLLRLMLAPRVDSLVFSLSIALIYLYLFPALMLTSERIMNATPFLTVTILIFDFIFFVSRIAGPRVRLPTSASSERRHNDFLKWLLLMIACSIGGLVVPPNKFLQPFAHAVPFAISLLYFERYIRSSSRIVVYIMLFAYVLNTGLYVSLYWNGFGRLVIGSMALMPLVIANRQIDIGLRLWQAVIIAPLLFGLAYLSRMGHWALGVDRFGGSAAHHLLVTREFLNASVGGYYGGLDRFLEQWSLLVLNWVPRQFWPEKPLGLALTSVDDWFGRSGLSEGHSVSVGMYGEQLYLLGDNYIAGLAIIFASLIFLRSIIIFLSREYYAPVAVFDVSLISYVWGGCGTFGSRAWFLVLPMCAIIVMWRLFEKSSAVDRQCINSHRRYVSSDRSVSPAGKYPRH